MKLHEILTEDQELQEGPLLNKIGTGIGKAVGGVAKAAGAVAGGIAGLGAAAKKGFQAGKQTVAGAGDEPAGGSGTAPAATGAAPAAPSAGGAQTQTLSNPKDPNTGKPAAAGTGGAQPETPAGGPPKSNTPFGRLAQAAAGQDPDAAEQPAAAEKPAAGAAQPQTTAGQPAADQEKPAAGAAKAAPGAADSQGRVEPTMGTAEPANDPQFQKVQQNISKLPPEQQKELMAALMADPEVKKALEQPAAADAEQKPAATPAAQPETPAAAAQTTDQTAAKPGRQRDAKGRFIGKNAPRAEPGPTQAEKDADRDRIMGVTSDSVIRKGKALSENTAATPTQTPQQQRQDSLKTFSAIQQGFERGRRDPFGNSDRQIDIDQESNIEDKSNTVPRGIVSALNTLSKDQRNELFKKLKAKLI